MNEISKIERKVDLLVSGIVLPKKRTRRRVTAVVVSVLIAMTLIASASYLSYYYELTGEIDVTSYLTITDPDGNVHDTGWSESETIGGDGDSVFYEGTEYISGEYTLNNNHPETAITVYFHFVVTEDGTAIPNDETQGLKVEVYNDAGPINDASPFDEGQITILSGGFHIFTIHVTADLNINAASTYGYTITIDWNNPGGS